MHAELQISAFSRCVSWRPCQHTYRHIDILRDSFWPVILLAQPAELKIESYRLINCYFSEAWFHGTCAKYLNEAPLRTPILLKKTTRCVWNAFSMLSYRGVIHFLMVKFVFPLCNISSGMSVAESNAREFEVVWFNLQQQMVYRHFHHPLSQQEGFIRGKDSKVAANCLLSRIHRFVNSNNILWSLCSVQWMYYTISLLWPNLFKF